MPGTPALSSDAVRLPSLVATDLACRRGNRLVFKSVSFALRAGEARWLRGRNGCGKTSLLRMVAGLALPAHGELTWDGLPVRHAPGYSARITYVAHANALKEDLTVAEALTFLARLHDRPDDPGSIALALERIGVAARRDAPVRTLSQGQRRRASLARLALERAAALWILDEPYDALDLDGIERLDGLLHEHLARGGSVLLTSHQPPSTGAPAMAEFDLGVFA
ncbi:MAG: cytochrome c biogenesis heme-transporting ATPase CcmA [Burkholderiaceae bacterium]